MIYGTTPFKGSYSDETFSKIISGNIKLREDLPISSECKDIMKKLLKRDVSIFHLKVSTNSKTLGE